MTNVVQLKPEEKKLTFLEIVTVNLTDKQVHDLWYDWFCKDESLVSKGRALIAKMKAIVNSRRFPATSTVFFKNNCPLQGRTYDSFSITDPVSGTVLFWVAPRLGYDVSGGQAQVSWGDHSNTNTVTGTWADVKKFFKSTDQEWAAYQATMPKPKFTVGTKVAILGNGKVVEDEVAKVGDMGQFYLKDLGDWIAFRANGEQVIANGRRRRHYYDIRRCEVWKEYHDALVVAEQNRKHRDDLQRRIDIIRGKLYSYGYGCSDEEVLARNAKLVAIEAILEITSPAK